MVVVQFSSSTPGSSSLTCSADDHSCSGKCRGSSVSLRIERRFKQVGKETGWFVYKKDKYVRKLWCTDPRKPLQIDNLRKGDAVTFNIFGNEEEYQVVIPAEENEQDDTRINLKETLHIRLKTCGSISLLGDSVVGKQWIEPCKTDNPDLDNGALLFFTSKAHSTRKYGPQTKSKLSTSTRKKGHSTTSSTTSTTSSHEERLDDQCKLQCKKSSCSKGILKNG